LTATFLQLVGVFVWDPDELAESQPRFLNQSRLLNVTAGAAFAFIEMQPIGICLMRSLRLSSSLISNGLALL
jgi:hypothetical protein